MKIAIVILNWNGQQLLRKFLPSVLKYSDNDYCEIYVVDNASTDESITLLQNDFPSVKIIQNKTNAGFAKGYNDGLAQIDAPFYALINSDIEVTKNWLEPILRYFKNNPTTAIIQPKILDYKNPDLFEYAGAAGGFIDKYGFAYCRGRLFKSLEKDTGQYNDNATVFWASGACLFIRSVVFKKLNGFDDRYFAHFEEIDLCWRAQNLNHKVAYVGESVVYHVGGATLDESNPKKTYLNYRNSLNTLIKNLPSKNLFSTIFIRLFLDGIAGIKFLIELKPKHTYAILKAHFSFYKSLSYYLKIRKKAPSKKNLYYTTNSIVWDYFIKHKKKYTNL